MPQEGYYLPTRRLVSQDNAAMIERPDVPRSRFTGTWTRKTTFDAGHLVPFMVDEVLPGDHLKYNVTAYLRMATPLFPMFDNQRIDTFFFFVPARILWSNWVKMMGQQTNPGDSIAFTVPIVPSPIGGFAVGSLYDHMGLPTAGQIDAASAYNVNVLPLRAYNRIFNAWFRDQNIVTSVTENTNDGPDSNSSYVLQRRAKAHDYFTTALPWPQKFTAPMVPLGGQAPIRGIGFDSPFGGTDTNVTVREAGLNTVQYTNAVRFGGAQTSFFNVTASSNGYPDIYADLAAASGVSINTLRQAWMIQGLMERDARGGTRYTELIESHFGVRNPDGRLQRPEYIGGGSTPLQITPIAQTAPTTGVPLGALGAAATASGQHRASYAATEHGYILGIINVRSELSYQQGLHKMWSRSTRYDFYWPMLSGLGEQAILRQEIYMTGIGVDDVLVFGYQERWHEYRTRYNEITGLFRSTSTGNIDEWHLAQQFNPAPTLNTTFINETPPMTRVLAAGSSANNMQYLADIQIERDAVRPLPTFGTPVALGRF